jgi:Cu/Zn superoxide dismutase
MKQIARTTLVACALVALQTGCPAEPGVGDNTGGRGGSSGTGGGGTGGGGSGGTGGGGSGGSGGRTPDAGAKRDTGKGPDAGARLDGARTPDAAVRRDGASTPDTGSAAGAKVAVAEIQAGMGGTITGKVTFTEVANGVQVVYALENCPAGNHPTHIHQGNGCDSVQAQGMHWDPPRGERINNNDTVVCGQDGKGTLTYVRESGQANLRWTIGPPAASDILGHPVVIHGVNNANQRHGCGIIRMTTAAQPVPPAPY